MRLERDVLGLIALIALLTIATRAVNYMVQSTVPPLARELGLTPSQLGALAAVGAVGQLIGSSVINVALGPSPRKKAVVVAAFAIPLELAMFWLSGTAELWIASFLSGLSFGVVMPNLINLASARPEYAERLLAAYSLSLSTSLVIGPAYETAILTRYGYRDVFLFFLPPAILMAALSPRIPIVGARSADLRATYRSALFSKGFVAAALAITSYNVPFIAFVTYLPIYASEELGLAKAVAYSLFLPFFAVSMLTRLYMFLRPVRDVNKAFAVSAALTLLGLAVFYASKSYLLLAAAMAILGVPHGGVFTLSTIMIVRTTSLEERNAVNSLFSSYLVILGTAVPPALGASAELWGYGAMWLVIAPAVAAMSAAFFALFGKTKEFRGLT
ncbi:MFS transporter [Pyrobaculum ferrireducens]|uniref:Major facilitator superfamily MFS_1 n=1 Tax=Pyrobaculum ferrireducens TaxID=1104324 RepID=G7VHT3_9CREN|nr:MFS transporter [Pyrobaculum ferrireducens]AET32105.1 major facilitator superfamily MFS_1 [Pyrobaculum ferrireducens]